MTREYFILFVFLALIVGFSLWFFLSGTGIISGNAVLRDNTSFPHISSMCNDSDGGIFSEVAGNVSYQSGSGLYILADECRERMWGRPVVIEYYCRESRARIISIPCRDECIKGSCVEQ